MQPRAPKKIKTSEEEADVSNRMILAAKNGERSVIGFLASGANPNVLCEDTGWTALTHAVKNGDKSMVDKLLAAGANPDVKCEHRTYENKKNGFTALMWASANGDNAIVGKLLAAGADPNVHRSHITGAWVDESDRASGLTALHLAAALGHDEVVGRLLAAGADPDVRDEHRCTALWEAANGGHDGIVRQLLAAGAKTEYKSVNGNDPLWCAMRQSHITVVEQLLDAGADPNNGRDDYDDGESVLMIALARGHEEAAIRLIDADADPNYRNFKSGWTVLMTAADAGLTEAVIRLIDAGADPRYSPDDEPSALMMAVQGGHDRMVEKMLDAGADPNFELEDPGMTVVMAAACDGHDHIVARLVAAGARPVHPDDMDPISLAPIPKKYRVALKDASTAGSRLWDARTLAHMIRAGRCKHPLTSEDLSDEMQMKILHIAEGFSELESAILRKNCDEVDRILGSGGAGIHRSSDGPRLYFVLDHSDGCDKDIRMIKSFLAAGAPVRKDYELERAIRANKSIVELELLWTAADLDPAICWSLLKVAVENDMVEAVDLLLKFGIGPHALRAIRHWNEDMVKTLVDGGARVDGQQHPCPLQKVCSVNPPPDDIRSIIGHLVRAGANVNARIRGETALTCARHVDVVIYLLAIGATAGADEALERARKNKETAIVDVFCCRRIASLM